jgi:hypothetical protein
VSSILLDVALGAVGGFLGGMLTLRLRRKPAPMEAICIDRSGPYQSDICKALRNPFCSDGRCRYHCQQRCKCPEVV